MTTEVESPMDKLAHVSSMLNEVNGMLLILADYVEGEAASAAYGIDFLVITAKAKLDQALTEIGS